MTRTQKTITLTILAAAFIAVCVMTCRSFLSSDRHTVQSKDRQCHLQVAWQDLFINLSGNGRVLQVRIQRLDGSLVARYAGCGLSQCNYSLAHLDNGTYLVTVLTSIGTYSQSIEWEGVATGKPQDRVHSDSQAHK
ncbi:MAG: hypothetical protein JST83_08875 [Bacteroidetes bacterium]|nr:hypothetical protein [Bacteroidota bacterium]